MAAAFAPRVVDGIPIDPKLPRNFDSTPNDARPASHERWWGRPFISTDNGANMHSPEARARWLAWWPSGIRYDVWCLDGGTWDRSTWWGNFATLEEAIACAKSGPTWMKASEPEPPLAVCRRCGHSRYAHDPSPHRSCRVPACPCHSLEGGPMPTPPPIRKRTPQTTIGNIIAREAERLPDLEAPKAADVGQMLQRIETAIGQHLIELVRNANARKEELAADPNVSPVVREASAFGYLVGSLGFLAQRWDGLEDLPELATPVVYGPDLSPDDTPTERPDR